MKHLCFNADVFFGNYAGSVIVLNLPPAIPDRPYPPLQYKEIV
ncbi:MAG: hypothetical protein R6U67_11055 [Sodalinema sp.]